MRCIAIVTETQNANSARNITKTTRAEMTTMKYQIRIMALVALIIGVNPGGME